MNTVSFCEELFEDESYHGSNFRPRSGGLCYGLLGGDVLKTIHICGTHIDKCIFHCHFFSCELYPIRIENTNEWYVNVFDDGFPTIYTNNSSPRVEVIGTDITRVFSKVKYVIDSQRAKFGNETVRAFKVLFLDTYEGTKLLSNYREE